MRTHAQLLCLALLCAPLASAQQHEAFIVAPERSAVTFTLGDVLHTVRGTFHVSSGDVIFNPEASEISGVIQVAAGSGASGNAARDRRMSTDILDAPEFAVASFSPQRMVGRIAPSGDSTVQVSGIFTLHGSPHVMSVPMQVHIDGDRCTAKTHFVVPYVQWGMKDPSTFVLRVAKEVSIDLVLVGQISPNAPIADMR
jgi:polyisoprenoid-binding protein YceI